MNRKIKRMIGNLDFSSVLLRAWGQVLCPDAPVKPGDFRDDAEALRGDWGAIGDDFRGAVKKATKTTVGPRV